MSICMRFLALGSRPLFTVESMTYSWDDVLAWAGARGTLEELQQRSRQGVAVIRRAAARQEQVPPEEISAAAAQFRYGRRLLSSEELEAWLQRWDLTVHEWGEYLQRCLAVERSTDKGCLPVEEAEVAEAVFVDAVCSGFLEREAIGFAEDTALAELSPIEAAGDRAVMLERIVAAAARARTHAVSESSLEREIANNRLDWTRLGLDVLELTEQGAAREAALCIRVDGRAISDVAAECQLPVSRMSAYLADLEPSRQPSLLSAQPGELVGPIEEEDSFVLVAVYEREPAAVTDPELRRRAGQTLVERATRRAIEGRVEWHEHL